MKAMLLMPFKDEFGNVHDTLKEAVSAAASHFESIEQPTPRERKLAQLQVDRVDYGHGAVAIVTDLKRRIVEADICIVDLTGLNENVVWEFGFVHALEKPSIVVTQKVDELTFDLKHFRVLVYDKNNLRPSLFDPLTEALIAVLSTAPEHSALPAGFSHARTLAMATASPTYFLDTDFRIQFMNQAAIALFYSQGTPAVGEIKGKPLSEFIRGIRHQILNLPSVMKTLYAQLEIMSNGGSPDPCSFETIVFNSERFGKVELRKAGIAVRDPVTGVVLGWVVSFNPTNFADPGARCRYYENHESVVKGELFSRTAVEQNSNVAIEPERAAYSWHRDAAIPAPDNWWNSCTFSWADSYDEKEAAFRFALDVMLNNPKRYGLESVHHLDEYFFDFSEVEYLIVSHSNPAMILGVCRVNLRYDVSDFITGDSLLKTAADLASTTSFADLGAYFPESLNRDQHRRILVAECLGRIIRRCEEQDCPYQYVQVPVHFREIYRAFGFSIAGDPFRCQGWGNVRWQPMLTGALWINDDRKAILSKCASEEYGPVVEEAFNRGGTQF